MGSRGLAELQIGSYGARGAVSCRPGWFLGKVPLNRIVP